MADPFHSPKRRIKRAWKHICDLDRGACRYLNAKPYVRIVEPDPDGIHELHKVKITRPCPPDLTDILFDAVENLRSALDHTMYAIATAHGVDRLNRVGFPVAATAADFPSAMGSNTCKELPPQIQTLLDGFKPYKGGNDLIWALNMVRRKGYHHTLVATCPATQNAVFYKTLRMTTSSGSVPCARWDSEKGELMFLRVKAGSKVEYNLNVHPLVTFGDIEAVAGKAVIWLLCAWAREVQRITLLLEYEARRIRLAK